MTRIEVAGSADVAENKVFVARANGLSILLTRVGGRAYAVENKCSHLGLSMSRASVSGATLQCPWHGSKFDVCSGKNLDWVNGFVGLPMPGWTHKLIALGKAPAPIRSFPTVEEAGQVYIELP